MGALSATWNGKYRNPFLPLVPGITHVEYNNLEGLEQAISEDTGAIIVEPVQGEGGVHPADDGYLQSLRRLCDERNLLLIFDEIQTGLGRTGSWFACQHSGVVPDLMCLGKALGGGVPMGAVVWRDGLGSLPGGVHGSTFGGNPLACAASRAVLDVIQEEDLPAQSAELGAHLVEGIRSMDLGLVREVRGRGLMVGIDLRRRVTPVLKELMARRVLALPAGATVLRLLPPLVISRDDLDLVIVTIGAVLRELEASRE
jgi:acetylornithine/LysW-gamma-L-lysine aminotransferase